MKKKIQKFYNSLKVNLAYRYIIFKVKLSVWLLKMSDKVVHIPLSRDSVLNDAKKIHPGAMILYDDDDRWKFAFRLFIDRGVFSQKEAAKYVARAEKQRFKKHNG